MKKRPSGSLSSEGLIAEERIPRSLTLAISLPAGEGEKGVGVGVGVGVGGGSVEGLMIVMEQQQQQEEEEEEEDVVGEEEEEAAAAATVAAEEEEEAVVGGGVVDPELSIMEGGGAAKKRRLGAEQVRALERSFEEENKLGPERKAQLARDLGLQPRQVAVWFQNRRARWKTRQLDRDFAALRSRHDALRLQCDSLRRDKDALAAEIKELKARLGKSEMVAKVENSEEAADDRPRAAIAKDIGTSDSDSSAVFNEDTSPYSAAASDAQCCFGLEFSSYLAAPSSSSHPPPFFDNKSQLLHKTFLEEEPLLDDAELHNLAWYCTGEWD